MRRETETHQDRVKSQLSKPFCYYGVNICRVFLLFLKKINTVLGVLHMKLAEVVRCTCLIFTFCSLPTHTLQ